MNIDSDSNAGRRRFGRVLLAAAAALAWPARDASSAASPPRVGAASSRLADRLAHRRRPLIRPPRLREKALVGLIAPGGRVDDTIIETCVQNLESCGFSVRLGRNIRAVWGGHAGRIAERLDDLHAMFADREVQAIWAARGGSGCTSLLPRIRYDLVRRHPKILIGYSDISALHLALFRQSGLVTFHGPVAWSTFSPYSTEHMLAVLMDPRKRYEMGPPPENSETASDPAFAARVLHAGTAEGRLIGGNLSIVAALAGTPFAADFRKRLLFLEDVGEQPYRIDRMLTQLDQSAGFSRAAGVMLGVFRRSSPPEREASLSVDEVFDMHFRDLGIPVGYGWPFGHVSEQMTLPLGVLARMNAESRTLTLLEPGVA